jgi:hypothetical protein
MSKLTLPIVIGKRYVRRDGVTITAKTAHPGFTTSAVYVGNIDPCSNNCGEVHVHRNTGRAILAGRDHASDLVADYIAPELPDLAGHVHTGVKPSGHPHAALMALYAQDAAETAEPWTMWAYRDMRCTPTTWRHCPDHPQWATTHEYRRKPKTIRIGEFDVPEPLRVAPVVGTRYWMPRLDGLDFHLTTSDDLWKDDNSALHDCRLGAGIVHLTREAAELHALALLSFTMTATGS